MQFHRPDGCESRRYAGQVPEVICSATRFCGSASSNAAGSVAGGSITGGGISTTVVIVLAVVGVLVAWMFFKRK